MEFLTSLLKLLGVSFIVFLNGFFVAAEFALVKIRATQIEPLVKAGSKHARLARSLIAHLDTTLSTTQLGITMTSLALGWLGEPFVAQLLLSLFGALSTVEPGVVHTLAFVIAFSIITFAHIVLGELAPKWLAIRDPRRTALAIASPLNLFYVVFRPFIWLLNVSANRILRLIGITPGLETDMVHSEEELRLLLSSGKAVTALGKSISLRAMELRERTVREVMVPRTSIVYLSTERTLALNMATALESEFTRFPLCEKNLENILGMIHLKDLFKLRGTASADPGGEGSGTRLLEIKREMLFVPETMALERMLNTFLARRMLMAIAVDEYGGTAGLVTLENVLEQLVGQIHDEFDVEPLKVQKVSDSEFLVDGGMPLHNFARMFEVSPATRDVVTVSGYAIQLLGGVPDKGASFRIGQWSGTVEATEKRKVKTIRMKKAPAKEGVVAGKRRG